MGTSLNRSTTRPGSTWCRRRTPAVFSNLYIFGTFYGIAIGAPSIENGNYFSAQPTADGSHWDGMTIYAANPVNIPLGNQNTFSNFNVYSNEGSTTWDLAGRRHLLLLDLALQRPDRRHRRRDVA